MEHRLLSIYLNDHVAGATAGVARIRHMAEAYARTPLGPELSIIAEQITAEREWLIRTSDHLGVRLTRWKLVGLWVAERAGRLKQNGRVRSHSPLSALLNLEVMRSAVLGKRGVWESLRVWSEHDPDLVRAGVDVERLDRFLRQTDEQAETLTRLLGVARERVARGVDDIEEAR